MEIEYVIQEDLNKFKRTVEEELKLLDIELNQTNPKNLPLEMIRSEFSNTLNLSKANALKGVCNEIYISNTETHFKFFDEGNINKLISGLQTKLQNIADLTKDKTDGLIKVVKRNTIDLKNYQNALKHCLDKFNKKIQTVQLKIRGDINSIQDSAIRNKYKLKLKDIVEYFNKNSKALLKKYLDILK